MHVFISAGLYHLSRAGYSDITIFEMGFGSGLNAYLTHIASQRLELTINYHTIESDPLNAEITSNLNYDEVLGYPQKGFLEKLHQCAWEEEQSLSENFKVTKFNNQLHLHQHPISYDLIYYDAFAPSCQPELWTSEVHRTLYESLNPGGCLVTYCSQGQFKRTLKELGYVIEKLNGPAKKREMIRATKPKT